MDDAFFRCYDRNQLFVDSLNLDEKMRAVAAANIRFDAERKEKENKLLSAQVELQQHQLFFNIYISIARAVLSKHSPAASSRVLPTIRNSV